MNLQNLLYFLAGAQAFHTLSHIMLAWCNLLPLKFGKFTFTNRMNLWAILINGITTVMLLWMACKS